MVFLCILHNIMKSAREREFSARRPMQKPITLHFFTTNQLDKPAENCYHIGSALRQARKTISYIRKVIFVVLCIQSVFFANRWCCGQRMLSWHNSFDYFIQSLFSTISTICSSNFVILHNSCLTAANLRPDRQSSDPLCRRQAWSDVGFGRCWFGSEPRHRLQPLFPPTESASTCRWSTAKQKSWPASVEILHFCNIIFLFLW